MSDLRRKLSSPHDLDHWPYERAQVLFDRDGQIRPAVEALGRMDPDFRKKRLLHATIDAWIAAYPASKTLKRGFEGAGRLIIARGARALSRILFALEWRWVPLDHWLEPELRTLADAAKAGPLLIEGLVSGTPEPLQRALSRLEEELAAEGVPRPTGRRDLFVKLIHPTRAEELSIHGQY